MRRRDELKKKLEHSMTLRSSSELADDEGRVFMPYAPPRPWRPRCYCHGSSVDTLRHALTRNGDGSPSGPLARVLDLLAGGI
jgi:hypothetical protein